MNLLVSSTNPYSFLQPPAIKFLLYGEVFKELLDDCFGDGSLVFLRVVGTRPLAGNTLPEEDGTFFNVPPSVTSFLVSLFLLI